MIYYRVCESDTAEGLDEMVGKLLNGGWFCQGGVSIGRLNDRMERTGKSSVFDLVPNVVFVQAMITTKSNVAELEEKE